MKRPQSNDFAKTEKVIAAYCHYIGECHLDNISKELENKKVAIETLPYPDSMSQWFEEFIQERKKREVQARRKKLLKRISSRAAMFLIVLSAAFFFVTVSVEAFRVRVFNFFKEANDRYTSVRVVETTGVVSSILGEDYYYPLFLPDGFVLRNTEEIGQTKIMYFENSSGGGYIHFIQAEIGTDFHFDTEDANVEEINICNGKGMLSEKKDRNIIFWHNEKRCFYIISDLSTDTLLDIAESIKYK